MTFSATHQRAFAAACRAIRQEPWFDDEWSCCSGLWQPERYGNTVLIRMAKRDWVSSHPITLTTGGEIQYAAWIDEGLAAQSTLRFELHVFSLLAPRKVKKGDFTDPFRRENHTTIRAFGHHDIKRGPAVPYAGSYPYRDARDLKDFLIRDFSRFATLAHSVDEHLRRVRGGSFSAVNLERR